MVLNRIVAGHRNPFHFHPHPRQLRHPFIPPGSYFCLKLVIGLFWAFIACVVYQTASNLPPFHATSQLEIPASTQSGQKSVGVNVFGYVKIKSDVVQSGTIH